MISKGDNAMAYCPYGTDGCKCVGAINIADNLPEQLRQKAIEVATSRIVKELALAHEKGQHENPTNNN